MGATRRAIAPSATLEGQETDALHIDTSAIPGHVRDDLAAATLDFIRGILQQPGGREALDARTAARRAAQTAKTTIGRS